MTGREAAGRATIAETVAGASETVGQRDRTSREVTGGAASGTGAAQAPPEAPIGVIAADQGMGLAAVEDPGALAAGSREEQRPWSSLIPSMMEYLYPTDGAMF